MNEDNTNAPTTPASRDCDTAGPDSADSRQTARQYLTRYHAANECLKFLKSEHSRQYAIMRQADPVRTEARVLLVEYCRLAGNAWIDPADELFATIRQFLSDTAQQRPLLIDISCALASVMVWQRAPRNRSVARFLDRVEALIMDCVEKENPSS